MRFLLVSAFSLALAQPALAQAIYLDCEVEGDSYLTGEVGVVRLTLEESAIVGRDYWDEGGRRWRSAQTNCRVSEASPSGRAGHRDTCSVEPGAYKVFSHTWSVPDGIDSFYSWELNRQNGVWASGLTFNNEAPSQRRGTCSRTEDPELTPARTPIL
jgi:hypothetical protein